MTDPREVVLVERRGAVAIVTLNRPERRNAIKGALLRRLRAVLADLDADPAVRAIVLTGAGNAFCAGMDLAELDSLVDAPDLIVTDPVSGVTGPWARLGTPVGGRSKAPPSRVVSSSGSCATC
jgi:enoyl-CoA hydratase/carnithine racemase